MKAKQIITALQFAASELVIELCSDLRLVFRENAPLPRQGLNLKILYRANASVLKDGFPELGLTHYSNAYLFQVEIEVVGWEKKNKLRCWFAKSQTQEHPGWWPLKGELNYNRTKIEFHCRAKENNAIEIFEHR